MQIRIFPTAEAVGAAAAAIIRAKVLEKEYCHLGLATGSTPIPTYRELIRFQTGFHHVTTYNLDEYCGLSAEHPCSYRYFMNTQLFDHIDICKDMTFVPNGCAPDMAAEADRYEQAVREAGIDLQVLGIGRNGHIGFNEPDTVFSRKTHVVQLTDSTIEANTRFFTSRDEVPRTAISMGIGTIMAADQILLIATGADKADAVYGAIHGDIDPKLPASILQLHKHCVFLLDTAAAAKLK